MKKILMVLVVVLMTFSALYGQDAGKWAVGGRFGAQIGVHKAENDYLNFLDNLSANLVVQDGSRFKKESIPNVSLVFFGTYGFTDTIGVQAEFNFMFGEGLIGRHSSITNSRVAMTYSSLDIPLLLKINFLPSQNRFGILLGPYFTASLGQVKTRYTDITDNSGKDIPETKNPIEAPHFGFAIGLFGGPRLEFGRAIIDLRYIMDFGASKIDGAGFMQRRGIVVTVGLDYTFK
ncbi:MAG: PorT family protein [Treponema sp.]|nr:PorT family protein [Treponema sp.]